MNLHDPAWAIVPTVMIPLAALGVVMSVIATTIAGFFGIKLKAEGPRQLLEVLLKPKVLLSALALNGVIWLGIEVFDYYYHKAKPLFWVTYKNRHNQPSTRQYDDQPFREIHLARQRPSSQVALSKIQQVWHTKLPGGAFRGATLSGGSVFISSDDGHVYELDEKDGRILRKFYLGTPVSPSSAIWRGHLFVGEGEHATHHARIYKFDLKTGALSGTFQTAGHTEAQPRLVEHEGRAALVFPAGGDGVYSIDPESMAELWHKNPGHADAEVAAYENLVFVATGRDKDELSQRPVAAAYDAFTGRLYWQRELVASSFFAPLLWQDGVCFATGEIYYPSDIGGLYCFHRQTGQPQASVHHTKPFTSVPLVLDDVAYLADVDGRVCALELARARLKWCDIYGEKAFSYSSVTYDPQSDRLLFAHRKDGLFALHPEDGRVLEHWRPENPAWQSTFASLIPASGVYISADMEGTIRGLSPQRPLLSQKQPKKTEHKN